MINKFILVWCVSYLYFGATIGESSQRSEELFDDNRCDFNSEKTYNVTNLLRCMDKLASDFFPRNNGRSLKQPIHANSLDYRENPNESSSYGDLILNLFNNGVSSIYHNLPLRPADSYYQLNRPDAPVGSNELFDGFGTNLLDALSSISRYDDLKCVPRILCEVASGKLPGEYGRASTIESLSDFGRNAFTRWLAGLNVAEASPVLNFARATVLGYSSRGNPFGCYRAYPRCPRNSDKLVHYLNNHNGGFFRFFGSRRGRESDLYPQSKLSSQGRESVDNSKNLGERKRKALPPGYAGAEADRTGTGELKFDIPVLSARRDYGKSFFPKENIPESLGRVVFPVHEESNDRPSGNRIPKSLSELQNFDVNTPTRESPPFFPRKSEDQDARITRFTPPLSVSHSEFRFPR